MEIAEEKLRYYFACEFLQATMTLHYMDQIATIILGEQHRFASDTASRFAEEIADFQNGKQLSSRQAIHAGDFIEKRFDDLYVSLEQKLLTAAHKLSDEMCWISEVNFVYLIFSQFVRGTLIAYEQIVNETGISQYTLEQKPDFKAFIEFLEKKTPSDPAAKVRVEALAQELTEMWRQEIDKAVAEYRFEE